MRARYYPTTDMLHVELSSGQSADSEEVMDGFVFDFNAEGKVVGIEVESASERVDLTDIREDLGQIVDDSGGAAVLHTISELARELAVTPRTIQKTIRTMREAGIQIGHRSTDRFDNAPIILNSGDVARIRQWRQEHRPGRPLIRV